MTFAPAMTPLAMKSAAAEPSQTAAEKGKDGQESVLDGTAFSKLLQGAQQPAVDDALSKAAEIDVESALLLAATEINTEFSNAESLLGQIPSVEAFAASLDWPSSDQENTTLDVESLLAQTRHLDQRADMSLRDGSHVLKQSAGSLAAHAHLAAAAGAQPRVAVGQEVATVAAGVQAAMTTVRAFPSSQEALGMAATVAQSVGDMADTLADLEVDLQGKTASSEGRFALQGAWTLDEPDTAPSATLQRLMGQIEHWAASSFGTQSKPNERSESNKALQDSLTSLVYGRSSGTQLTENAVREVQESKTAAFEAAQEAPVEDMRFWLQGKQQRAELTLDRDGQAVRVQVSVNGNEAHVNFLSEKQQTRDLLDASLAQLREMLAQQGVQLLGVSVQAQADSQQPDSPPQDSDNAASQQSEVQHARIAVPEGHGRASGQTQGLDVYA